MVPRTWVNVRPFWYVIYPSVADNGVVDGIQTAHVGGFVKERALELGALGYLRPLSVDHHEHDVLATKGGIRTLRTRTLKCLSSPSTPERRTHFLLWRAMWPGFVGSKTTLHSLPYVNLATRAATWWILRNDRTAPVATALLLLGE